MTQSQIEAFLQAASSDTTLQNKIQAAGDPESLVEIAQQAGFSISVDDIKGQSELSEEDLQGISGGGVINYQNALCGAP